MQLLSSLKFAAQNYKLSSLTLMQCATPKDVRAQSLETESKVRIRCTPGNRAMLVKNLCGHENTSLTGKGREAIQHCGEPCNNHDLPKRAYRNSIDELTEKLLLLKNVDFILTKMVNSLPQ